MLNLLEKLQEILNNFFNNQPYASVLSSLTLIIATVFLYWLVYSFIFQIFKALSHRILKEDSRVKPLRIQRQEILSANEVATILNRIVQVISWTFRILIIYSFLNTTFRLFDWTRSLATTSTEFIFSTLGDIWQSFVDYLPDLFTALIIIFIAHLLLRLLKLVFEGVERSRIRIPGFYPEWASTCFGLMRLLVITLTLIVVFPYLPGSDSPAFQGVSIFFGVLLSLGSTTAVANVVAGIVITFTRAFKIGDQIRISDAEGKVIERTAFVTRLRTPKNVEVSIPNAAIMSDKVINYSSQAKRAGITLHTAITLGYNIPWTQVHELLKTAASLTEHVESEPAPYVLQTALDDNYVSYELNVTTREADHRPRIYSDLHANILDEFNSAGVEIISPQYRSVRDGNQQHS